MFGLLKKKLKSFVEGIVKKEKQKPDEKPAEKPVEAKPEVVAVKQPAKSVEEQIVEEASREVKKEEPKPRVVEEKPAPTSAPTPEPETAPAAEEKELKPYIELKPEAELKKELKPKVGLVSRVKSIFSGNVTIAAGDVEPMFSDLELSLLESDVSVNTTHYLIDDLRKRLVGKQVSKTALGEEVNAAVRGALLDLFPEQKIDLLKLVEEKKSRATGEPFVVFFLGPNGSGKTTAIAKLAHLLKNKGLPSVLAASDTFRAAAIDQLEEHGRRLGLKVVRHDYRADPTAVAFDAISHAKANQVPVVLVDTAGRQETNYNLVKEMEKMNRVLKPDLRIFVGEAIAGHALVEQVKQFKEKVGVDAIILTKLDCDAKGGSAFSVAFEAKTPIVFIGVGQEYGDLRPFDAEWLVGNVLAG